MAELFSIVTFPSTHAAMKGERAVSNANLKATVIPVPRYITADCGIALRFSRDILDDVKKALEESGVAVKGVYEEQIRA